MKQQVAENLSWRAQGWSIGRGLYKFYNGMPCSGCGRAAIVEVGGNGKAGSGERKCGECRKEKKS